MCSMLSPPPPRRSGTQTLGSCLIKGIKSRHRSISLLNGFGAPWPKWVWGPLLFLRAIRTIWRLIQIKNMISNWAPMAMIMTTMVPLNCSTAAIFNSSVFFLVLHSLSNFSILYSFNQSQSKRLLCLDLVRPNRRSHYCRQPETRTNSNKMSQAQP